MWFRFALNEKDAQHWLCFLAIAEELDDFVWNWLKITVPPSSTQNLTTEEPYLWRGFLFRSMFRAQLAHAQGKPADTALTVFFRFIDKRTRTWQSTGLPRSEIIPSQVLEHRGIPAWLSTSASPAALELRSALGRRAHPGTNPQLYDRFLTYAEAWPSRATLAQNQLAIARLYLSHPLKPSAEHAIEFLRRHFEQRDAKQARKFLPTHEAGISMFEQTFRQAARVAKQIGLGEDAVLLEGKHQELFSLAGTRSEEKPLTRRVPHPWQ